MAVLLRCAGWNMLRALAGLDKRGIRDFAVAASAFHPTFSPLRPFKRLVPALDKPLGSLLAKFSPMPTPKPHAPPLF